jgi:hypothetical protein
VFLDAVMGVGVLPRAACGWEGGHFGTVARRGCVGKDMGGDYEENLGTAVMFCQCPRVFPLDVLFFILSHSHQEYAEY